jgi:hypothetical protein
MAKAAQHQDMARAQSLILASNQQRVLGPQAEVQVLRGLDDPGLVICSTRRVEMANGPAHTHRIPRPILTPRQGSSRAHLEALPRGVLVSALRPACGGGVLRRHADGYPRFLPQPLGHAGSLFPGAGAPAPGRCRCRCRRPAPVALLAIC